MTAAESNPGPLYITTPIYYVNDRPHIGHAYTTAVCDVIARYGRFAGRDVFFLTGTDEHATKVVDAAEERGVTPQQWADTCATAFKETFDKLQFTHDDFIRTSEDRHKKKVQEYVAALLNTGDVYLGEYEGWYDAGEEEYVPEGRAKEYEYKSPISGRPLVRKTEHNFFFKLSAYKDEIIKAITNPDAQKRFHVRPESRRNEILRRLEDAQDVPMSRTGIGSTESGGWGIAIPDNDQTDEQHTVYVWVDALFNYLTTVDTDERRKYWQAGALHLIAKDILWFHAAIWPGVLLALQKCPGYEWVRLPHELYTHSFWISEGQKMSKSLGNFIDLETIQRYLDAYGLDMWRYYMVTKGPLGATDADFTAEHYHETYSTDLVNTVGNCASRVTAMINKYFDGAVPSEIVDNQRLEIGGKDWPAIADQTAQAFDEKIMNLDLAGAVRDAIDLISQVDTFINATEPFKLINDESKRNEVGAILHQCLESVRIASLLLWPVLPNKMVELWDALGLSIDPNAGELHSLREWGQLQPGSSVRKVALFPRVDEPLTADAS